MNLLTHPVWSKVLGGLIVAALTATTTMTLTTRERLSSHIPGDLKSLER